MSLKIRDVKELLNILKDVKQYIFMQSNNEKLANEIVKRIDTIFNQIGDTDG